LMLRDQHRQAETVLRRAIAAAKAVDARATEGHALCSLSPALVRLGRLDAGLEAMGRAQELCRAYGTTEDLCRTFVNLVDGLYVTGRYDDAERAAVEGMAYAESTGHLRHYGEAITGNRIAALILAGRWPQAAAAKAAFELR
jgi:hypothetical protein